MNLQDRYLIDFLTINKDQENEDYENKLKNLTEALTGKLVSFFKENAKDELSRKIGYYHEDEEEVKKLREMIYAHVMSLLEQLYDDWFNSNIILEDKDKKTSSILLSRIITQRFIELLLTKCISGLILNLKNLQLKFLLNDSLYLIFQRC